MSELKFQVGELVDITIKGARVVNSYQTRYEETDTGTMLVVEHQAQPDYTPSGVGRPIAVNLAAPGVSVERVAPVEWPPQVGDLWRDRDGGLWFAYDAADYDEHCDALIRFCSSSDYNWGTDKDPDGIIRRLGPLTLVHRAEAAEVTQ